MRKPHVLLGFALVLVCLPIVANGNGGPFVIRYPSGDPAAKGVLAGLHPDLKPMRETRLRVVKEDLQIVFPLRAIEPVTHVTAEYTIQNPTAKAIQVDFGFPILRGIASDPESMFVRPDVRVKAGGQFANCVVISNSVIYGIIRQRARATIEKSIAANKNLAHLVRKVSVAKGPALKTARADLLNSLTGGWKWWKRWNARDAALMVEYASIDWDKHNREPLHGYAPGAMPWYDNQMRKLAQANLGPLRAIGDQKATQFLAQLAAHFDPKVASTYESIFTAWGGDVRERSVDLKTGKTRPRELTVDSKVANSAGYDRRLDPTVYARIDYLDHNPSLSADDKASCKAILKNLPVVFTYAPMNLLHYRVKFPAKSKQVLSVSYRQYPYVDTAKPATRQLCYVLHPASLWKDFGPINLEVAVPKGVAFRASVPCRQPVFQQRSRKTHGEPYAEPSVPYAIHRTTMKNKTGELFVAVGSGAFDAAVRKLADQPARLQGIQASKSKG
ncbi:MAG: hypothetical protein Q7T82_15865 [Armatimonadota bacterium]|nr:hypothetical protein [Armatimonadota bacterium]